MRVPMKITMFVAGVSLAALGSAAAEKGTAEQREACTPDAFRLCMFSMPDEAAVEQCLRSAGPKLSAACYAVFNPPRTDARATKPPLSSYGQMPASRQTPPAGPADPAIRSERPLATFSPQIFVPGADEDN